jgi:hypothetical protein
MTTRQPDPGALDKRIMIICAVVILGSFMSNLAPGHYRRLPHPMGQR